MQRAVEGSRIGYVVVEEVVENAVGEQQCREQ